MSLAVTVYVPSGIVMAADSRMTVLRSEAHVVPPGVGWAGRLYRTAAGVGTSDVAGRVTLTAVPYYAWANREPGPMAVWVRATS